MFEIDLFLISISNYLKYENGLSFIGVVEKTNESVTELGMV
jgi:hypothetical protein